MKKSLFAAFTLIAAGAFSANAGNMTIRYRDGSLQTVHLKGTPSQITQITIGDADMSSSTGSIRVLAGTYGANCGTEYGNKTQHLATACNGKKQCEYKIDHTVIGDPAVGCAKEYIAEWQCGSGPTKSTKARAEAGFGSVISLTCP